MRCLPWRRILAVCSLLLLLPPLLIWAGSFAVKLPSALELEAPAGRSVLDRGGLLLAKTRGESDLWYEPLSPEDLSPRLAKLVCAAEDSRFYSHPGVDVLSVLRAAASSVLRGRIVSGASTLTQQVARTTFKRDRNLWGKLKEMSVALALERRYNKEQILLAWLNRVQFGPQVLGIRAASQRYFSRELSALELSQTAMLLGIARGPTVFDPERHLSRAARKRDVILRRALKDGLFPEAQLQAALEVPAQLALSPPLKGGKHWVRQMLSLASSRGEPSRLLRSSLSLPLQREAETMARAARELLGQQDTTASALVVLDNRSGEILAWVGSPRPESREDQGDNDGVLAPRQPGSTLKPFLYALAVQRLGYTPATVLNDTETSFVVQGGFYTPQDYDRRTRGRVRMRRALANSLNIPAVGTVNKLGVTSFLDFLHTLGFASLQRSAADYGPALALGDGEVQLLELARAYAILARGGQGLDLRFEVNPAPQVGTELMSKGAAALITDILADPVARQEAFGRGGAFELPFPVALKTGTSKAYRDAWTVGYTKELTVAVWVGNFDGRPMQHLSGAVGAAPLFAQLMRRAMERVVFERGQKAAPLVDIPLERRSLCSFVESVDSPLLHTVEFETSEAACRSRGGRFLWEKFLPGSASITGNLSERGTAPRFAYPLDQMSFEFEPHRSQAHIPLRIQGELRSDSRLGVSVDGGPSLPLRPQAASVELGPGHHRLVLSVQGVSTDTIQIEVKSRQSSQAGSQVQ